MSNFNFFDQIHGQSHIFGDHAHQENRFGAALEAEERHQLLEELFQEIRAHEAELPNPDGLISTADELATELRQGEPHSDAS